LWCHGKLRTSNTQAPLVDDAAILHNGNSQAWLAQGAALLLKECI
jgi:hypothetical protein